MGVEPENGSDYGKETVVIVVLREMEERNGERGVWKLEKGMRLRAACHFLLGNN